MKLGMVLPVAALALERLHALMAAADRLFRAADGQDGAAMALEALERTFARVSALHPRSPELASAARALYEARSSLVANRREALRESANRVQEAAVLLVGRHVPAALTLLLVARIVVRDALVGMRRGEAADCTERRILYARGLVARVARFQAGRAARLVSLLEQRLADAQAVLDRANPPPPDSALTPVLSALDVLIGEMQDAGGRTEIA